MKNIDKIDKMFNKKKNIDEKNIILSEEVMPTPPPDILAAKGTLVTLVTLVKDTFAKDTLSAKDCGNNYNKLPVKVR